MIRLAVCNSKGGVGKSAVSVHLAWGLALKGHRVMLIDLDTHGSATEWLIGLGAVGSGQGTAEAIRSGRISEEHLRRVPVEPDASGVLDLMPATTALSGIDAYLAEEIAGESVLRRMLHACAGAYDFVVIDCPSQLSLSVVGAIVASDGILVPIMAAHLSLIGLRRLEDAVARVRERMDVKARVLGYVMFAADPRESVTEETREVLRREAKGKLFKAEVRVSTRAKTLSLVHKTSWDGDDPRGAEDYSDLLAETLARLQKEPKS